MLMFVLVVAAVVIVIVAAVLVIGFGQRRGRRLKKRFGPEYEHVVLRHKGDTNAAEAELGDRVRRHGALKERSLSAEAREGYAAQWVDIQAQFIDSPSTAVADADALLSRLAEDRGFPPGSHYDDQVAALSVHHSDHVRGYRDLHTTARSQGTTQEMREAMIRARGLFIAMTAEQPAPSRRPHLDHRDPQHRGPGRHHRKGSTTS
ncbi:hypothetical protein N4G70_26330 [Streptomyces sp. ASQP_92]|uniref:hypothetical protein n=1 Tax=Streptomyces sp. ASQP_92 TaxID=2979116 RepID=UPI0021BE6C08|nr:hypothetical protein [Streptomyces sp. ASQP_92]MCT9092362.1 hypothetical protein [Streptomyces sp. ASQP_92]